MHNYIHFKSNQINLRLFDVKSTMTVTDAKVVYRIHT